jgi:hypothetical protein
MCMPQPRDFGEQTPLFHLGLAGDSITPAVSISSIPFLVPFSKSRKYHDDVEGPKGRPKTGPELTVESISQQLSFRNDRNISRPDKTARRNARHVETGERGFREEQSCKPRSESKTITYLLRIQAGQCVGNNLNKNLSSRAAEKLIPGNGGAS